MPRTPSASIIWSQWLKTRGTLIGISLGSVAFCSILYLVDQLRPGAITGAPAQELIITTLFIVLVTTATSISLLLVHSDAEKLHVSLPIRTLRLPLPTWKIVAPLMVYAVATIAVMSALATFLINLVIMTPFSWWIPIVISTCVIAMVQAWALAFGDINPRAGLAAVVVGVLLLALLIQQTFVVEFLLESGPIPIFAATLVVLTILFGLAVVGVSLNRHGGLPEFSALRAGNASAARARKPRFKSALKAQLWHDWRCFGWQLPLCALGAGAVYFLGMPLLVAMFNVTDVTGNSRAEGRFFFVSWLTSAQFVTTGLQIAALFSAVSVGAYLFMKAGHWNVKSTFFLTKPVPTRTLALARLSLMFKSTLLGVAGLMSAVGIISGLLMLSGDEIGFIHYLRQGYEAVPDPAIMAFFWSTLFVFMWTAIWSVNLGFAMFVFAGVLAVPFVWTVLIGGSVEEGSGLDTLWQYGVWAASGILAVSFLLAYIQGLRYKLIAPRTHIAGAVLWIVGAVVFTIYGTVYDYHGVRSAISLFGGDAVEASTWPYPIDWPLWFGLSIIPIAPIFTHPLQIHWARHQ